MDVDWEKTAAWAAGGYYGRIFFNIKGREPKGIVDQEKVESFSAKLATELERDASMIGVIIVRPQDIYSKSNGVAPDLMVFSKDMRYRFVGAVRNKAFIINGNDLGEDVANHGEKGICIYVPANINEFGPWERQIDSIFDITPAIGYHMDLNFVASGKRVCLTDFVGDSNLINGGIDCG